VHGMMCMCRSFTTWRLDMTRGSQHACMHRYAALMCCNASTASPDGLPTDLPPTSAQLGTQLYTTLALGLC
jgi:hypothetical protein